MISIIGIIFYLCSCLLMVIHLLQGRYRVKHQKYLAHGLSFCGLLLHFIVLYSAIVSDNGLNLSVFNTFSLASWMVISLLFILALIKPVEFLTIITLPIASLALMLEKIYPTTHIITHLSTGLQIHIFIALLAYSILSVAAVQAILLAIQDYHLHHKKPAGFMRALPPLQSMEVLLFDIIVIGFIGLSMTLLSGAFFLHDIVAQHLVHKTVLSIFAWLIFAILLWGRWQRGWRSITAIRWTLSGFFILILAYFGSQLVLEIILHRV